MVPGRHLDRVHGVWRRHGRSNVFVLDVATGRATQITDGELDGAVDGAWDPTFTPEGSSLVYSGGSNQVPELRTVPVDGGVSTLLIGPGEGIDDAGNGTMSPDGSLVTFLGGGFPTSGEVGHCGPCRLAAPEGG
jgi:Tol biopolymer transport system component